MLDIVIAIVKQYAPNTGWDNVIGVEATVNCFSVSINVPVESELCLEHYWFYTIYWTIYKLMLQPWD